MNLVLSFQAAYAAPVLLMSANRQAEKDRLAAHNGYIVGQRAEEENRAILHHLEAQDELMIALLRSLNSAGGQGSGDGRAAGRGSDHAPPGRAAAGAARR